MGKRTNTILQSAFFTLAKVLPQEEAIGYMKDAATHSYLKKGQDVVDANHKAIDAGATAFVKIDVPASWADASDETTPETLEGPEKLVKQIARGHGARQPHGRRQSARLGLHGPRRRPMGARRLRIREAWRRRHGAALGRDEVHPVQQLLVRMPARDDPSLRPHRRGGCRGTRGDAHDRHHRRQGRRDQVRHRREPARLHGLRRLRQAVPRLMRSRWCPPKASSSSRRSSTTASPR